MKKLFLFIALALFISSCNNDEPVVPSYEWADFYGRWEVKSYEYSGGDISDCGIHPLVFTMFDIVDAPTMFPVTCRTGQAIVLEVEFEPSTLIFTSTNNFAGVKFQIIDPDLVSTPKTMKIEVIDGGSTGSDFYEGIIYSVEL